VIKAWRAPGQRCLLSPSQTVPLADNALAGARILSEITEAQPGGDDLGGASGPAQVGGLDVGCERVVGELLGRLACLTFSEGKQRQIP